MNRPSFQFYPGDWQGNAKLRRCNHAEKGIWIDIMCLLHDSEEYGVLRWPLADIAQAIGCRESDIHGLIRKHVMKGADDDSKCEPYIFTPRHAGKDGEPVTLIPAQDGPIWFSSRMIRDEYIRLKRGESTRFDGQPKVTPKPPIGGGKGDGPSSSSSSSSSTSTSASRTSYTPEFEKAWGLYPTRSGGNPKRRAFKAWCARIQEGRTAEQLIDGVRRYAAYCKAQGKTGTEYVKQAATFFGPDEEFNEAWKPGKNGKGFPAWDANLSDVDYSEGLPARAVGGA